MRAYWHVKDAGIQKRRGGSEPAYSFTGVSQARPRACLPHSLRSMEGMGPKRVDSTLDVCYIQNKTESKQGLRLQEQDKDGLFDTGKILILINYTINCLAFCVFYV